MIETKSSKIGNYMIVCICILLILVCILPLVNVLSRSLSSADALVRNEVMLLPVGLNFNAYSIILSDPAYTRSLWWTALLTVICVVVSMTMTVLCAYPLTYPHLKGRRVINTYIIITMYFSAGVIPNYLLFKSLGMLNTPSVLILPGCLSVFNMIILRSFFYGIPESLRESAELDGAGPIRTLVSIYLPLAKPALATLSLFYAVGRWNGFSDALMFVKDKSLFPIQLLLYNIINNVSSAEVSMQEGFAVPGLSLTIQSATIVFATLPILLVYPWLQKYFIAGATLGAVKE